MTKKRKKKSPQRSAGGRASKRQERQAARKRQERLRLAGWGIAGLVVVAIIGFAVSQSGGDRPAAHPDEQDILVEGRQHVPDGTPLNFAHYPPSSGPHYGTPLPWGFYETEQSAGNWVHSLEHGGVVALYNCPEGCPELVDQLRGFYADAPRTRCGDTRIVITPYSRGMETPLTMIAWGKQLDLAEFDAEALTNFFLRYEDRGPETIPCS